jgi:two-component system chemotaxis response regulator CheY
MSKKVLVVDDSATVRQQVGLALGQAGFDIVEAVDGQDGVEKIYGDTSISLVVCDVNMPRLNGIEMLEKIRAEQPQVKVPVIMLTTEGHPALMERAKKAGAKGWIVKPFKAELLIAAAKKLTAS